MNIRYPIYEGVYRILTVEETGDGIFRLIFHDSFHLIDC